ncbi:MAG: N-formylglutamate amidohydrolase [Pseudomonadota bacterium]
MHDATPGDPTMRDQAGGRVGDAGSAAIAAAEPFLPVETVGAASPGRADILLLCDHASNAQPPGIALGIAAEDMARHIAWDVGARGVTLAMAEALGAPAVLSRFSRLVIDPNRGEDDPTLVMKLYDGTLIAGNRHVDAAERERRLAAYHRPYHEAITGGLDAMIAAGHAPKVVSIHSFTPQLRNRPPRPWHVGLLWDRDARLVEPLFETLADERLSDGTHLVIGDNEPYTGALQGDCMFRHGTARGLPHVLIELRNDLIVTEEGQGAWGRLLAGALLRALERVPTAELSPGFGVGADAGRASSP